MTSPVKFEGVCHKSPDHKRPYMPGIVASTVCDGCGAALTMDFGNEYPAQYIEAGKPFEFNMFCASCNNDNMRSGVMRVTVHVEPTTPPTLPGMREAVASGGWNEMWDACESEGVELWYDMRAEHVEVRVCGLASRAEWDADTTRASALREAIIGLLEQMDIKAREDEQ